MIIIETCPKCGYDLVDEMICTMPPIPKKVCYNCGWSWEGKREEVMRVPFSNKFDKGDEFFGNDKNLLLGDIGEEFVRMGYSEEDSITLTNLAVESAVSYNGVLDIVEATNSLVTAINGVTTERLSDLK